MRCLQFPPPEILQFLGENLQYGRAKRADKAILRSAALTVRVYIFDRSLPLIEATSDRHFVGPCCSFRDADSRGSHHMEVRAVSVCLRQVRTGRSRQVAQSTPQISHSDLSHLLDALEVNV